MAADILDILASTPFWIAVLRIATPLIFGTLGVLLCERAGVLNLGIEGIMVVGAFTGWLSPKAARGMLGASRPVPASEPRAFDAASSWYSSSTLTAQMSWAVPVQMFSTVNIAVYIE